MANLLRDTNEAADERSVPESASKFHLHNTLMHDWIPSKPSTKLGLVRKIPEGVVRYSVRGGFHKHIRCGVLTINKSSLATSGQDWHKASHSSVVDGYSKLQCCDYLSDQGVKP